MKRRRGLPKRGSSTMSWAQTGGWSPDELLRPGATVEPLAGLKPAFYDPAVAARFPQISWEITPGNSSPLSDGSAAVLITSREAAKKLGLRPPPRITTPPGAGSHRR